MPCHTRADIVKNRLLIRLEGFIGDDEIAGLADMVIAEAKKLKPGFSTINDITTFRPTTPKGADEITRAQKFLKESGAGHVVRVVGEKVLASIQFKRTQNEAGYIADHVATIEDAERLLDEEEAKTRFA